MARITRVRFIMTIHFCALRKAAVCMKMPRLLPSALSERMPRAGRFAYPPDLPDAKIEVNKTVAGMKLNRYIFNRNFCFGFPLLAQYTANQSLGQFVSRSLMPMPNFSFRCIICSVLLACEGLPLCPLFINAQQAPYNRMYVFGDSYSDIGEGYLDGNGPTAVAYLASPLGFVLSPANTRHSSDQSLDFAISGATTGSGDGKRIGGALLGRGMRNQVDDFAAQVRSHVIKFDSATTLFFIAGGLNDEILPNDETVQNLESEIRVLFTLGARDFLVALLPTAIPDFKEVGTRLNPAISRIPNNLSPELHDIQIHLSHWGLFFDAVIQHPGKYGITNTIDPCAGRKIFRENIIPCTTPASYFYYHRGHPSTMVHKIVGDKLYDEVEALSQSH